MLGAFLLTFYYFLTNINLTISFVKSTDIIFMFEEMKQFIDKLNKLTQEFINEPPSFRCFSIIGEYTELISLSDYTNDFRENFKKQTDRQNIVAKELIECGGDIIKTAESCAKRGVIEIDDKVKGLFFTLDTYMPYKMFLDISSIMNLYKATSNEELLHEIDDGFKENHKQILNIFFQTLNTNIINHLEKKIFIENKIEKDKNGKIKIFISEKDGIYLKKGGLKLFYPIRHNSKRKKIITELYNNRNNLTGEELINKTDYKNISTLSKEIKKINKKIKDLGVSENLIIKHQTGGYGLNNKKYNIMII